MKLLKLEMYNFRQYIGEQEIVFADDDKNITIIFGENGMGKTGLFRALMFSLYGSTHIQQDNSKEPIHLVSMKQMEKSNGLVEMYVKTTFEHADKKYILIRSMKGFKRGDRIEERAGSVKLKTIDENGNLSPYVLDDALQVKAKMNEILDEDIKDFFLFDGEKIDTLAKTNDSVKKEVRTAIFKLLQIDNLEEARQVISNLKKREKDTAMKNAANESINQKNEEIQRVASTSEGSKQVLEEMKKEGSAIQTLISQYELQLSENEDIKKIQDEIKQLKFEYTNIEYRVEDSKDLVNELVKKDASFLLFYNVFPNVKNYVDQIMAESDNIVPIEVLENSLSTNRCACCNNDLAVHEENLRYITALKQNYRRSETSEVTSKIRGMINDKQNEYQEKGEKLFKVLRNIKNFSKNISQLNDEIQVKNQEIGSKANADFNFEKIQQELERQRENQENARINIQEKGTQLTNLEKELEQLEAELSKLIRKNESLAFDAKVIDLLEKLNIHTNEIAKDFSDSMRTKLTEVTTNTFKELIDRKDLNLIKKININPKFELEIVGYDEIEITQDISQGQRQIVALAFITALAQLAAGDDLQITFPLFMDSPFNRLSGNNRDQLIKCIPSLTSQWILLLTDTELTENEESTFKVENRLGKFYKIRQNDVMDATIVEMNIDEKLATREMM